MRKQPIAATVEVPLLLQVGTRDRTPVMDVEAMFPLTPVVAPLHCSFRDTGEERFNCTKLAAPAFSEETTGGG